HPFLAPIAAGQCIRIMTGAVIPPDCDCVIPHEKVASISTSEIVLAAGSVKSGANCRRRGEDLAQGELAMSDGTLLQAAQIGMLASLGIAEIEVYRRLKVAFFSTGDELQALGNAPAAGMLYDSNRYSMQALLTRLGCETVDLGIVQDQPDAIRAALLQAAKEADVVLTSGGMAGGDADFTRRMMQELGDVHFWQLLMRPGRPFAFGHLQSGAKQATLFGLPGNPVALMISFYMLVRPALLRMMGVRAAPLPQLLVSMDAYAIPNEKLEEVAKQVLASRKQAHIDAIKQAQADFNEADMEYRYEVVKPHSSGHAFEVSYEGTQRGKTFFGYVGYVSNRKIFNLFVNTQFSFVAGRRDMFSEVLAGFAITLP
ncbi:MAG: molybdopterin molybdotransferase MoeA, partial [Burkholderiales bacterium]|nr:molybdopterin molybdotransferase MoeA [Burkholderiales bacterium]